MDDLVTRLRELANMLPPDRVGFPEAAEAADEIERLTAELERVEDHRQQDRDLFQSDVLRSRRRNDKQQAKIERLTQQVEHLSQYARCSCDQQDGIAHGGAAVCQACFNRAQAQIERLTACLTEIAKGKVPHGVGDATYAKRCLCEGTSARRCSRCGGVLEVHPVTGKGWCGRSELPEDECCVLEEEGGS